MDTHAIKLVVHNFWADANARVDLKMHLLRKQSIHLWSWMYLENVIMLMGECKGLGWKLLNSTIKRCCPLLLSLQCIFFLVLYTIENVRLPQVLSLWHCQRSLTVIKQQRSYNIGMFYAPGAWSLCDSVFCYGFPNDKLFLRLQKRIWMIQNQSVLLQKLWTY